MKAIVVFLLLIGCLPVFAQKAPDLSRISNQRDRLAAWTEYCDACLSEGNYAQLRVAGKKGIALTGANDYTNKSLFHFYTGITFDYGVESDSAAFYLERSEALARKGNNGKRIFEALRQLSYVYAGYGLAVKRQRVVNELEHVLDTATTAENIYAVHELLGDYYVNRGEYEQGLSHLLNGVRLRRKLLAGGSENDSINFGVQLIVVAELYIGMGKFREANGYLRESEAYIHDYKDAIAHVHKDFIESYLLLHQPEKAHARYKRLQEFLADETSIGCWGMLVESDVIFANYYRDRGDLSRAMAFADHARALAPQYADAFQAAQVDYITGSVYLGRKDYAKALVYLKKAEPTTSEDDPELRSRLKLALSETYAGLGKWDLAYAYRRDYAALQDTLLTEKSKKNIAEMEARYQNEKKQAEINQLNTVNALQTRDAERQRLFFVAVIAAVLVIGGLVYAQSRNRQKHNRQLQSLNAELGRANAVKARFFSILNHDLRSPVANLIHFLHVQKNSPELLDEATRLRLETRTIAGAENLLGAMEDMLLWSKGQMENFRPEPETLDLQEVLTELTAHFSTETQVRLELDIQPGLTLVTDRHYLLTILRNLTANAVKVLGTTEHPLIRWTAAQENHTTVLAITDNGPGAAQEQFRALYDETEVVGIRTGLGLHLIRDLAQAIGCAIRVNTQKSGTTIRLEFPVEQTAGTGS